MKTSAGSQLLRVSAALPTTTGNLVVPLPHHNTLNQDMIHQRQSQHPPQQQIRWKHSERQIKRLFRNHPALLRVEQREGIDRTPDAMPPPQFEAVYEPHFLPNGWSAPPDPSILAKIQIPEYPFRVARTKNKPNDAAGFLPVYSNFRRDGARVTTRVKKVTGDREFFIRELRSVLELPPPKNGDPRLDTIRVRVGGTIEVKGNRVGEITQWLAGLGF